jgi:hypothetical protein
MGPAEQSFFAMCRLRYVRTFLSIPITEAHRNITGNPGGLTSGIDTIFSFAFAQTAGRCIAELRSLANTTVRISNLEYNGELFLSYFHSPHPFLLSFVFSSFLFPSSFLVLLSSSYLLLISFFLLFKKIKLFL